MAIDTTKIKLKDHVLPERYDQCILCHTKKNSFFAKKSGAPKREHSEISAIHGKREMSCHMCHDINNHNYLLPWGDLKSSFKNPSPACARCHQEKFRDWSKGLHGKRLGGWMQPKIQYHCIDCHKPHLVRFPKMQTVEDPVRSQYVIPKIEPKIEKEERH